MYFIRSLYTWHIYACDDIFCACTCKHISKRMETYVTYQQCAYIQNKGNICNISTLCIYAAQGRNWKAAMSPVQQWPGQKARKLVCQNLLSL